MQPNDVEALVSNDMVFRTWVVTTLNELKASQDAQPEASEKIEERLTSLERKFAWGAGVGTILLAIVRFVKL